MKLSPNRELKRNNPIVLITGDGRCVFDDIEHFQQLGVEHDVYCICRSIRIYPGKVDHWADVDAEHCIWWAENLPKEKLKPETLRHTLGECRGFDVAWDSPDYPWNPDEVRWHGSTSLFAVLTAIEMGYQKIILAGCPMDFNGHWFDESWRKGPPWDGETFAVWLDFARTEDATKVRSMSGYTEQILGRPDEEWLNGREKT